MRHVLRFTASLLAVLLFSLSSAPSIAQNEPFETAEKVPPSIHHVASGGFWTAGKDEGFFRSVVIAGGVEHVSHRLFIQWLRSDAKTQRYRVVRTVNVTELNLGHGHVLEVKTSFGEINAFKVDVTANSRGGKSRRFAITAKGDGKYAIRTQ
jgi:hypothetical protein